jgi:ELWxxDGT repeat protein
VGSTLYFSANNGVNGSELWLSDGKAAGTVMVKDMWPGASGGFPTSLTAVGSTLYFSANNGVNGSELWLSDGTAAGTVMVKDMWPGAGSGAPTNLTVVGSAFYFVAGDPINGRELWKSDGTAAGTVMVKDIRLGAGSPFSGVSYLEFLTAVDGTLYFVADDGVNGLELWKSDGTAAGTVMVKDIRPGTTNTFSGFNSPYLTAAGGTLYFVADDGVSGLELWKSNGTAGGTVVVKDIVPGAGSIFLSYEQRYLTAVGNMLYFSANDGVSGTELWKSDGTAVGTVMVKDIRPGPSSAFNDFSPLFTVVGSTLYFIADNGVNGAELWKSDGTAAGTVMVKDIRPGAGNGNLLFLTTVGSTLYFSANDGINGGELWKSDGTAAGTVMVKDIRPGAGSASVYALTAVGSTLYFAANDGVSGLELWKSDGTAAGTVVVKDIFPGASASSVLQQLTAVGSILYFAADDGVNGFELWKSDGTTAGTVMVKDIVPGAGAGSVPQPLTAVGSTLYFQASDPVSGRELWKSDGTAAGTVMVKDVYPGANSGEPRNFIAVGSTLYFEASDGVNGYELWKSDGTAAGTVMVKDIFSGAGNIAGLSWPRAVGSTLYFQARDESGGEELWRSDGTEAGTFRIADLVPGSGGSSPQNLTVAGSRLFFSAYTPEAGRELFAVDVAIPPTPVTIDVRPNQSRNRINLTQCSRVRVAVLSSRTFDALAIDQSSIAFGRTGTEAPALKCRARDAAGGPRRNLVCTFSVTATGLQPGDTTAVLTGLVGTTPIIGSDSVDVRLREGDCDDDS